MSGLPAILDVLTKLSGVGFGVTLLLVLYGSYAQIWVWGKDARDDVAGSEKRRYDEVAMIRAEREADQRLCDARIADLITRIGELRKERDLLIEALKNRASR